MTTAWANCGANNYNCILNIFDPYTQSLWLTEAIDSMVAEGAQGVFADSFVEGISGYDVVAPDNGFSGTNPASPSAWPNGVTWLDQRLNWMAIIHSAFIGTSEQFLFIPNVGSQATSWVPQLTAQNGAEALCWRVLRSDSRIIPIGLWK